MHFIRRADEEENGTGKGAHSHWYTPFEQLKMRNVDNLRPGRDKNTLAVKRKKN